MAVRSRTVGVIAACCAAFVLVGCGGSSDSTPSAASNSSPISAAEKISSDSTQEAVVENRADGGIWFDEEPQDPLDKLVFASQRFVGKPLKLRPIEGEDVDPVFLGQPDICDPQVVERMREIGIEPSSELRIATPQLYACNFSLGLDSFADLISHNIAAYELRERSSKNLGDELFSFDSGVGEFKCIAADRQDPTHKFITYTNFNELEQNTHCHTVSRVRQIISNVHGGALH